MKSVRDFRGAVLFGRTVAFHLTTMQAVTMFGADKLQTVVVDIQERPTRRTEPQQKDEESTPSPTSPSVVMVVGQSQNVVETERVNDKKKDDAVKQETQSQTWNTKRIVKLVVYAMSLIGYR